MTDADLLLDVPDPEYGSGVIGVCDVCGRRQAVIVLAKERFKLCVIDFLNKSWSGSPAKPGVPLPLYRSERVSFPTVATKSGKAPGVLLTPTKVVRHPVVLVTPDSHGLTTSLLDGAIRFAREGFEVLLPDLDRAGLTGPSLYLSMELDLRRRGGIDVRSAGATRLGSLFADALAFLRGGEMVDPGKSAVFGLSRGGALALALAAEDQKLSALALAYPVPVLPVELVRLVSAPILVLAGHKDPIGTRAARQIVSGLPPGRVRWVDAGSVGHHFLSRDLRRHDLERAEAAWLEILRFLRERLLPPAPKPPIPPIIRSTPAAGAPRAPPLSPSST